MPCQQSADTLSSEVWQQKQVCFCRCCSDVLLGSKLVAGLKACYFYFCCGFDSLEQKVQMFGQLWFGGVQGCGKNRALRIGVVWVFGRGVMCCGRLVILEAVQELGSSVAITLYEILSFCGETDDQLNAFVTSSCVCFFHYHRCLCGLRDNFT